jgi:hypothetical protein
VASSPTGGIVAIAPRPQRTGWQNKYGGISIHRRRPDHLARLHRCDEAYPDDRADGLWVGRIVSVLGQDRIGMLHAQALPRDVGTDQCGVELCTVRMNTWRNGSAPQR